MKRKSEDQLGSEAIHVRDIHSLMENPLDWEGFERQRQLQPIIHHSNLSNIFPDTVDNAPRHNKKKTKSIDRRETRPLPKLQLSTVKARNGTAVPQAGRQSETNNKPTITQSRRLERSKQAAVSLPAALTSSSYTSGKNTRAVPNRYPRIPIVRVDENSISSGIILYRGMEPRTSDRFFTNLQDVNYMGPIGLGHNNDRLKEPLSFNSKFQSGNLNYVLKYNLHIRVDTNTQGHRQWYFFSICNKKNSQPRITYHFNIRKFSKKSSLYARGMKPYTFSKKEFQSLVAQNNGEITQDLYYQCWKQAGTRVKYVPDDNDEQNPYFVLTFDYEFKHQADEVFFAACPPYSYTTLLKKLDILHKRKVKHQPVVQTLTKTVCGLDVPIITVQHLHQSEFKTKKYIVIMGRSHPGESSGSWVMDGLMDWIYSNQPEVEQLLTKVTLKIIPMMNPDGVFMGNYRTGITGKDYNRSFNSGKPVLFPQIAAVKILIEELQQDGQVAAFLDLHGHSVLRGSFIFGPSQSVYSQNRYRRFPEQLSEKCSLFRYISCRFRKNQKSKIETARVFFQFRHDVLSFTIQNSLGLKKSEDGRTYSIRIDDWRYFGRELGEVLSNLAVQTNITKPISTNTKYYSNQMLTMNRKKVREELSVQLQPNPQIPPENKIKEKVEVKSTINRKDKDPPIIITPTIDKLSNSKIQAYLPIVIPDVGPSVEEIPSEDDTFSQNYDSDENDEDSQSEDLPADIINSVYRAIELKEYGVADTFRTVSNKGLEGKCTEEVIHQQILKNKKFTMHRNTNAFKQMKLSIRRLTPRIAENKQVDQLSFNDPYGDKAVARQIGTSSALSKFTGRGSSNEKVSKVEASRLKAPTTQKLFNFERDIMEQVNHQIDSRLRRLSEKPRSIFSTKINADDKPGSIHINPKFLYPKHYK